MEFSLSAEGLPMRKLYSIGNMNGQHEAHLKVESLKETDMEMELDHPFPHARNNGAQVTCIE